SPEGLARQRPRLHLRVTLGNLGCRRNRRLRSHPWNLHWIMPAKGANVADAKHRTGKKPQTVIIGGGVCGLVIGWQLAQAGQQVCLLERGRCGQGATHAAAGMLAAAAECEPGEEQLLQLTRWAQELW